MIKTASVTVRLEPNIMPRYNAATMVAMQETEDISTGKIPAKNYHSARELLDELDAGDD